MPALLDLLPYFHEIFTNIRWGLIPFRSDLPARNEMNSISTASLWQQSLLMARIWIDHLIGKREEEL